MRIEVITPPAGDVITLDELKSFLRLDTSDISEDSTLQIIIDAAVENCELYTSRVLRPTGFRITKKMINCSSRVDLIKTPLTAITLAEYDIGDGFTESQDNREGLDDYPYFMFQDTFIDCCKDNTFKVEFTAGYTSVPAGLKLGVLQLSAFYYENRGDCNCTELSEIPAAIASSFDNYSVYSI